MTRTALRLALTATLCIGLPALGLLLSCADPTPYLEFPPRTRYIAHAGFSWTAFVGLALVVLVMLALTVHRIARYAWQQPTAQSARPFPRWGWLGLLFGAVAWTLAWTRLPLAACLQPYTFIPLWLTFILVMNALAWRRTGACPALDNPRRYAALFPLSAAFWWYFEYLNRFVQNWFYVGVEGLGPAAYAMHATLAFSTVLPAVEATAAWLGGYPRLTAGTDTVQPLHPDQPRRIARGALVAGGGVLLLIPMFPNHLFPFLWLAPLVLLGATAALDRRPTVFTDAARGDWRPLVRYALAALICGFFWELWNYGSYARWVYAVPYVGRFHLFEMPILGFAGYLPFGVECALVAHWLPGKDHRRVPH